MIPKSIFRVAQRNGAEVGGNTGPRPRAGSAQSRVDFKGEGADRQFFAPSCTTPVSVARLALLGGRVAATCAAGAHSHGRGGADCADSKGLFFIELHIQLGFFQGGLSHNRRAQRIKVTRLFNQTLISVLVLDIIFVMFTNNIINSSIT